MNRTIKFRAWNKKTNAWEHKVACDILGEMILLGGWMHTLSIKDLNDIVILQYTGMKDKNGEEIFEGDIWERNGFIATVEFENCEWKLKRAESSNSYQYPSFFSNAITGFVIGNIFENAKMLQKGIRVYGEKGI